MLNYYCNGIIMIINRKNIAIFGLTRINKSINSINGDIISIIIIFWSIKVTNGVNRSLIVIREIIKIMVVNVGVNRGNRDIISQGPRDY